MADYIVCHKKRNSPRLNVRICQEKCLLKNECKEYAAYLSLAVNHKPSPIAAESTPVAVVDP